MDANGKLAMSAKQVAVALGVSKRHVERLDAASRLPAPVRIGKSKRWRTADIQSWLAMGCPDRTAWLAMQGGGHET